MVKTKPARPSLEVNLKELDQIIEDGMRAPLSEADGQKLKAVLHTLAENAAPEWRTTEKTAAVLGLSETPGAAVKPASNESEQSETAGHGRNAAAAFQGAPKVTVSHAELKPGDRCPECG